jgi:hypothetical protein
MPTLSQLFDRLRDFFTPVSSDLTFWEQIVRGEGNASLYRLALIAAILLVAIFLGLIFYRGAPKQVIGGRTGFLKRLAVLMGVSLLAGGAAWFQSGEILDKRQRGFQLYEDTLYLPSARTVRTVALGYDEALASFLFLRAIQAYGGGWQFGGTGGRPKLFEHYFDVITDLDPHFTRAYVFGNMLVGDELRRGAGDREGPAAGLALMVKGLHFHPTDHTIPYQAGFFAQDRLQDYERAVKYYKVAIQPERDAPDWVERQLHYFAIKSGQFKGGIEYYLRLFLRSIQEKSDIERNIAKIRLVSTQEDWGFRLIRDALEEYKREQGAYPANLTPLLLTDALAHYEFSASEKLFPVEEPWLLPLERLLGGALQARLREQGGRGPVLLADLLAAPEVASHPFALERDFPASGYASPLLISLALATREYLGQTGQLPQTLGQLAQTRTAQADVSQPGAVLPPQLYQVPLWEDPAFVDPAQTLPEQFDRFSQALLVTYQGRIPPTPDFMRYPDRHGWSYRLVPGAAEGEPQRYLLRPRREELEDQIGNAVRERVQEHWSQRAMPPADETALAAWLNNAPRGASALPKDPAGSLFFYNPITGEGNFASAYLEGWAR